VCSLVFDIYIYIMFINFIEGSMYVVLCSFYFFCCCSRVRMFFKSGREYFTAQAHLKPNENHTISKKKQFSTDSPHNREKRQKVTDAHRTDKNANIVMLVR
jgi:hypothetical protein